MKHVAKLFAWLAISALIGACGGTLKRTDATVNANGGNPNGTGGTAGTSGVADGTHPTAGNPTQGGAAPSARLVSVDPNGDPALNLLFGPQVIGFPSVPRTILLRNSGTAAAVITAVAVPAPWEILGGGTCAPNFPVPPQQVCSFIARLTPLVVGDVVGQLLVDYNGRREILVTLLAGAFTPPQFTLSSPNFGDVLSGTNSGVANVVVTNVGQTPASPNISFASIGHFPLLSQGTCAGNPVIPKDGSCYFQIRASLNVTQFGNLNNVVATITNFNGSVASSNASVGAVAGGQIPIFRKRLLIPNVVQTYLPTQVESEANALGYVSEGVVATLYQSFNSNCNIPVYRAYFLLGLFYRHMMSLGGEPALTYEGLIGFSCNQQTVYSPRRLERWYHPSGIWIETASEAEKAALAAQAFSLVGSLGWVK